MFHALTNFAKEETGHMRKVSKGVVDISHLPQCEFSNLQFLPLVFLLHIFAGQSLNSFRLVVLLSLKHEDDLMMLLCFSI